MTELNKEFASVLAEEHLDDLSIYGDPEFCDEVPLYSRYKQVNFLSSSNEPNKFLLQLALDYLDEIRDHARTRGSRFLAITVPTMDETEYIVPHVFVCNDKPKTTLKKLHLNPATSEFGKYIKLLVQKTARKNMVVLQDESTIPGDLRVFIGYKSPPEGILKLQDFANGATRRSA